MEVSKNALVIIPGGNCNEQNQEFELSKHFDQQHYAAHGQAKARSQKLLLTCFESVTSIYHTLNESVYSIYKKSFQICSSFTEKSLIEYDVSDHINLRIFFRKHFGFLSMKNSIRFVAI